MLSSAQCGVGQIVPTTSRTSVMSDTGKPVASFPCHYPQETYLIKELLAM